MGMILMGGTGFGNSDATFENREYARINTLFTDSEQKSIHCNNFQVVKFIFIFSKFFIFGLLINFVIAN